MLPSIEQETESNFTLNELIFCYQYCTFVKSHSRSSPHGEFVETFLAQHPLPTNVDHPIEWSKDEVKRNEAGDRFLQPVNRLPTTDKKKGSSALKTAKNFA